MSDKPLSRRSTVENVRGELRATVSFDVVRIKRGFFDTTIRLRDEHGYEFDVRAGDTIKVDLNLDVTPREAR